MLKCEINIWEIEAKGLKLQLDHFFVERRLCKIDFFEHYKNCAKTKKEKKQLKISHNSLERQMPEPTLHKSVLHNIR